MFSTVVNVLRIIPETLNELRVDVQEIVESVCDLFGLDNAWTRVATVMDNVRTVGKNRPKPSSSVKGGRNRSLIRMIGSRLDLKPPKRYHFRMIDAAQTEDEEQLENGDESLKTGLLALTSDVVCNVHIKHRWSMSTEHLPRLTTDSNSDDIAFSTLFHNSPMQSTPKRTTIASHATVVVSTDVDEMRAELKRLRSQIAAIILMQEATKSSAADSVQVEVNRTRPHPPPPPPLPSHPFFITSSPANSVVKTGASYIGKLTSDRQSYHRIDMTDILRDIGNVQLRKVERSPGGTPVRNKAKLNCDANDPAAIMAAALKRRFSHLETLQESHEAESPDSSVWDSSGSPFASPMISTEANPVQHQSFEFVY